jgi:hypothetical protein
VFRPECHVINSDRQLRQDDIYASQTLYDARTAVREWVLQRPSIAARGNSYFPTRLPSTQQIGSENDQGQRTPPGERSFARTECQHV